MSNWLKKIGEAAATGGLSLLQKPAQQVIDTVSGAKAVKKSSELLQQQAQQGAAAFEPFREAGASALGRITDILSGKTKVNLTDIPGYSAGLGAGEQAIRREAAHQGTQGGGTLAALFGFGQQYAGKAFSDYMDQLRGVANIGVGATEQQVGQQQAAAQAQAAGILGKQQAYTNLAMTGLNLFGGAGGISGLLKGGAGAGGGISGGLGGSPFEASPNYFSWS